MVNRQLTGVSQPKARYAINTANLCLHGASNPQLTPQSQQLDYATLIIEKFTYTCIKLSVLFFYRRIFYQREAFRVLNNILIGVITLWGLLFVFLEAFTCGADSNHGHPCAPNEWLSLWFAITDVLGDIAVLTMPYPCIRALQMNRREKVGLSAIFMLGML